MIRITKNHDHRGAAWTPLATAGALCLALTLAPAAAAQDLINVRAGSAAIDFEPTVAHGGLVLTVSGPDGFYHREEFGAGESAAFSIFDQDGGALPDGSYTWELTAAPTDVQRREALEANRLESRSQAQGISPVVESGSFAVIGGSLVAGGEREPGAEDGSTAAPAGGNQLATKDQVINDDLIVIGSECLGLDCANGEVFSFDTLRLKENNLRIKFEDTSTGSFPSTDWQLTANDSANGGANRFSIDDVTNAKTPFTVEGNSPSNTLYVDSTGRVGFGTSTPALNLHVATGNSPGLRLEQNTSAGFAAQSWDIAGNEANFFVRDATGGSTLPFRIRPGAPTSSIDIAANGNVGVGTTAPGAPLHIVRNGVVRYRLGNTDVGTEWDVNNDGSGDFSVSLVGTGKNEFEVEQDGSVGLGCTNPDHALVISGGPGCTETPRSWIEPGDTSFSTTSSRTVKENIAPVRVEGILDKVRQIPVYEYDFIEGPQDRIGLMAEEFHQVFGRGSDQEVSGHEMQLALWLAVQELIQENKALREKVEGLMAER